MYLVKIQRNNQSKFVTLPSAFCRGQGLSVQDTLLLRPNKDGTITIYPPKLLTQALSEIRHQFEERENSNA